ncbi:transcriptional regulator [Caballeronia pedi]|uniref:transcriptional regulator n=1 Tax=Caballeronia pedi TaxID=1777141 RepID=UPI000B3585D6|nr:YdaS family helix-turn-helix protein [Caballeronia pedi]
MDLKTYFNSCPRGTLTWLAAMLDVSTSYLSQLASGRSPISPARCVLIERLTKGIVRRQDLRPHDWIEIWPEVYRPRKTQTARQLVKALKNNRRTRRNREATCRSHIRRSIRSHVASVGRAESVPQKCNERLPSRWLMRASDIYTVVERPRRSRMDAFGGAVESRNGRSDECL